VKVKLNIVILIGAVLCLASMLFSYLSIDLFIVSFGIKWDKAAQYTNYVLYAVPVIGILLLMSGVVDIKPLAIFSTVAAIIVGIYYVATFRNVLNGDLVMWLNSANALIQDSIGEYVNANDLQKAIEYLKPFTKMGTGAWIYLLSCLVSLVGVFVSFLDVSGSGSKSRKNKQKSENNVTNSGNYY